MKKKKILLRPLKNNLTASSERFLHAISHRQFSLPQSLCNTNHPRKLDHRQPARNSAKASRPFEGTGQLILIHAAETAGNPLLRVSHERRRHDVRGRADENGKFGEGEGGLGK